MKKFIKLFVVSLLVITSVAALGGCGASFNPERPIVVVSREKGSGTRDAFLELIGFVAPDYPEKDGLKYFEYMDLPVDYLEKTTTAAVLAAVKSNGQAIGYDSLGYVKDDVKKLRVGGVECTVENIKNGTYKVARPLSVCYKEAALSTEVNAKFLEFLMSKDSQTIAKAEGYIEDDAAVSYVKKDGLSGTIKVSGSTSLEPLMKKLVAKFKELQPGVTVDVTGGGSGTGRNNVRDNVSQFGMVSAEFTSSHAAAVGGNAQASLVARDGIAVIVNKANTNDNITMAQLRNIYDKDAAVKYTKWADIN
jgi:phosphate transport system substrate-binding protein